MKKVVLKGSKFLLKIAVILLVTASIILIASNFMEWGIGDAFFIVGALYIFIGGIGTLGDARRRTDFEYLHMRSISSKSSMDEIGKDKMEMDRASSYVALMIVTGILLIVIGGYL